MRRAVIRADAGPEIGAGHVMRCLALAAALRDTGFAVAFASGPATFAFPAVTGRLGTFGRICLAGDAAAEAAEVRASCPDGADILVVDHYGRGMPFESACRLWARRIVVLDDLADRRHDADVLVSAGAASPEPFRPFVPAACRILTGPAHALIRPEFLAVRAAALDRRNGRDVERILVSFGASATGEPEAAVLAALSATGFAGTVDLIGGGAVADMPDAPFRLTRHALGADMPALITATDLAVGAAGATAWERACLGLPSLIATIAANQRGIAAMVAAAGAGIDLGPAEGLAAADLASAIMALVEDPARRRLMAKAGAQLIDGLGGRRIVAALTA
jgi:UDP-2,4-diacetamido-2,4,6-trideoxy-beta-L-altropyranose hydrolase